jgi:hypothetical protein
LGIEKSIPERRPTMKTGSDILCRSPFALRKVLPPVPAVLAAGQTHSAAGQESQGFYRNPDFEHSFTVPSDVTEVTSGGFGGFVQADLSVTAGQTLCIWVGCLEQDNLAWGWGNRGYKGAASGAGGEGDFGGGAGGTSLAGPLESGVV